jgi:hypothetical protein
MFVIDQRLFRSCETLYKLALVICRSFFAGCHHQSSWVVAYYREISWQRKGKEHHVHELSGITSSMEEMVALRLLPGQGVCHH